MWDLSTKEILEQWIVAAEKFCKSRTPNYGRFTETTKTAHWICAQRHHPETHFVSAEMAGHQGMAQHLLKATPQSGRDTLDRALLGSEAFIGGTDLAIDYLASWCRDERVLTEAAAAPLVAAIKKTVRRRRKALQRQARLTL
jgi:hypothetical protein